MRYKPMTFRVYASLHKLGIIAQESEDKLKEAPRPEKICGRVVPQDLNALTMDQLTDLMDVKPGAEINAVRVILGIDPKDLDKEPAVRVVGLVNFIQSELERITELFKQLKPHYTSQERQAGVEDLSFGIFGTIDWYARRMGFTDHDEVLKVQWIKIYECARIDKENFEYERRYRDIIYQQNK